MNEKINIEYTTQIWKEDDQFIAHAMPLDVISSGRTAEEARKALDEAVQLFLETAADMGTLEEIVGMKRSEIDSKLDEIVAFAVATHLEPEILPE